MKVDKLSISLDHELADDVREAAERVGSSVSAWMSEAARDRLRQQLLTEYLADYEADHGSFTAEELAKARAELGHPAGVHDEVA